MRVGLLIVFCLLLTSGCGTSSYLKGVTPTGEPVYLTSDPFKSLAFFRYQASQKREIDKINYVLARIRFSEDLVFIRDGQKFDSDITYKGGQWLLKKHFTASMDTRTFLRQHVWRSEKTGTPYYIQYPDGSVHVGYYIMLNELSLLDGLK